jgi:hypothetical protein
MQRKSVNWKRATCLILLFASLSIGSTATGAGHSVTDFTLSPATPNILANNKYVTITFSYSTTQPGGVIIFARPMTGDSMPDYAASDADVSKTGSGTG